MLGPQLGQLADPEEGASASVLTLQRDLLREQLQDLDSFVSQARRAGVVDDVLDADDATPAAPGLESLLRAQLREVQSWLEEVRRREPVDERPPVRPAHAEERLLLSLHHARARGRQRQVDRGGGPERESAMVRGQRLEVARDGLLRTRDAETLRRLALERAQGVRLQSSEDLARLGSQLRALESDPRGRSELARYAPTDVALAFVGAIEQRRALVRSLSDALTAHHALRSSVETYEQLLASARAEALPPLDSSSVGGLARPPEARPITASPAARLVLANFGGVTAGEARSAGGPRAVADPQAARLQCLAERNAELWATLAEQLSGQGPATSVPSRAALPPLQGLQGSAPGSPAAAGFPLGSSSALASPSALRSELRALRAKEGRLDELLGTAGGAGGDTLQSRADDRRVVHFGAADHHRAVSSTAPPPLGGSTPSASVLATTSGQPGDDAAPEVGTGFLSGLSLREILEAWAQAAHEMRSWRRSRREAIVRQMLGSRGVAVALFALFSMLVVHVERPPHLDLGRGEVMREIASLRVGTLCSVTPKGICKVAFMEGEDVRLVNMATLKWLEPRPHPALAGLCLHGWGLAVKKAKDQGIVHFREKLLSSRRGNRNKSTIVRLASAADDPVLLARLCFEGWRNLRQAANARNLGFLAEAWFAWRQGLLCSRHSRAVSELDAASGELHHARMAVLRQTQRFERLERKMTEMDDMHNLLWCSWIMTAWQWVVRVAKVRRGLEDAAREERSQVTLLLTEKMAKKSTGTFVFILFKAWADSMSRRRQLFKVFITRKFAAEQVLFNTVFSYWKTIRYKLVEAKMLSSEMRAEELRGQVQERDKEMEHLQALSQNMFGFATDSAGKVQQLEHALAAAQKAMQVSESHGELMAEQVAALEEHLEYEAVVPGEARARLAAQLHEDAVLHSEVHSINYDRQRLYDELFEARQEAYGAQQQAAEASRRKDEALFEAQEWQQALLDQQEEMRAMGHYPSSSRQQLDPNVAASRIQAAYRASLRRSQLERQSEDLLEGAGRWRSSSSMRSSSITPGARSAGGARRAGGETLSSDYTPRSSSYTHSLEEEATPRVLAKAKTGLPVKAAPVPKAFPKAKTSPYSKAKASPYSKAPSPAAGAAWKPKGVQLPDLTTMEVHEALGVAEAGATVTVKGGMFTGNKKFIFKVNPDNEAEFIQFFKEEDRGTLAGVITMDDLSRATWDAGGQRIQLSKDSKTKQRVWDDVEPNFLKALLVLIQDNLARR